MGATTKTRGGTVAAPLLVVVIVGLTVWGITGGDIPWLNQRPAQVDTSTKGRGATTLHASLPAFGEWQITWPSASGKTESSVVVVSKSRKLPYEWRRSEVYPSGTVVLLRVFASSPEPLMSWRLNMTTCRITHNALSLASNTTYNPSCHATIP